jgi:hypothetical protein
MYPAPLCLFAHPSIICRHALRASGLMRTLLPMRISTGRLREASKVKQLSEAERVIERKDARIKELEEERQGGGPFDFAHDEVEAIATTLLQFDRDKAVRLARLILDELPAAEPPRVKRTAAKAKAPPRVRRRPQPPPRAPQRRVRRTAEARQ